MRTTCKAKISMILSRVSNQEHKNDDVAVFVDSTSEALKSDTENGERVLGSIPTISGETGDANESTNTVQYQCTDEDGINEPVLINFSEISTSPMQDTPKPNNSNSRNTMQAQSLPEKSEGKRSFDDQDNVQNVKASARIATGDSQAIAIIPSGNKGFFTIDLWEVLLRIIGLERAANRRSVNNASKTTASSRPNVMII